MIPHSKTNSRLHIRKVFYPVSFVPRVAERVEHLLPKRLLEVIIFFVSCDIELLAHAVVCLKLTPKDRCRQSCHTTIRNTLGKPSQFGPVLTRLGIALRVAWTWCCHTQQYRLGVARCPITFFSRYRKEMEMYPFDHRPCSWTGAGASAGEGGHGGQHRGKQN